jgi:glycosyltransferase involved in cell wall biosynthesis
MATLPSYLQSLEAVLGGSSATPSVVPSGSSSVPALPTFLSASELAAGLTTSNAGSTAGKLKLLFVGTHAHQFTGYSKVVYNLIKVLAKDPKIAVTHFGFQKNPSLPPNYRPYPPNVRVLDAAEMEKRQLPAGTPIRGFGFAVLPEVIRHEKPDIVFVYNDMGVVAGFLEEIRKSGIPRNFKIWVYVDQVYNCQPQSLLDILNRDADRVFAFTKYWKNSLKEQGITRPIDVLGHGFEKDVFTTVSRDEIRKKLGLPLDAFIITSLNRNQPRKRYDILIMAFVELILKYPTKPLFLMCVCDRGEKGGWWLLEIFARELKLRNIPIEKFGNRLLISSQDMVFRDEDINMFYNLANIGVSASDGEGWGLCNFEQMGVGVPQVVPNIGGFKDYCNKDNSVLVKPKYRFYQPSVHSPVGGEAEVCDPHDICVGLEEYITDSEKCKKHGEEAKKTVCGYTWEKVSETFIKRLHSALEEKDEE